MTREQSKLIMDAIGKILRDEELITTSWTAEYNAKKGRLTITVEDEEK